MNGHNAERVDQIERVYRLYRHRRKRLKENLHHHREVLAKAGQELQRVREQMHNTDPEDVVADRPAGWVRVLGHGKRALSEQAQQLRELRDQAQAALVEDRERMTRAGQVCRVLQSRLQEARTHIQRRRQRATLEAISERAHSHRNRKEDTDASRLRSRGLPTPGC